MRFNLVSQRGDIWHTSQEWQSNLIGIDRAANVNAFQNQVAASSPRTALDFSENHAATRDKMLKLHRAFHNRHLKCFLFIEIFFTKFEIIDPLLFYNFIVIFGNFVARDFLKARRYLFSKYFRAVFRISQILVLDRARIELAPPGCKPGALPLC